MGYIWCLDHWIQSSKEIRCYILPKFSSSPLQKMMGTGKFLGAMLVFLGGGMILKAKIRRNHFKTANF